MGSICAIHRASQSVAEMKAQRKQKQGARAAAEVPAFVPPVTRGTVLKVYDGDTITIAAPLHINGKQQLYRFRVRLRGIDCPELRGSDENEKAAARRARDILAARIRDQPVILQDVALDKYGRLLAEVYHRSDNLSAWMLNRGLARRYAGRGAKWRDLV